MRIKELFNVPEGKKITEKALGKVLVSSVFSILLCVACLAGTTWAWFAVSVENTENVIEIRTAAPSDVEVTINGSNPFVSGSELPQGQCIIDIKNANPPDDLNKKATLYVTLLFDGEVAGYVTLNSDNQYHKSLEGSVGEAVVLSWTVSWFPPDGTEPLENDVSWLDEEATEPTEETTEATEPTGESTEATDPTDESTEATEPTGESTEATDPTDESTEATEPTGESTEATEPTDESTEATEPTAESTEATDPTDESTEATEPTGESTEATEPSDHSTGSETKPSDGTT